MFGCRAVSPLRHTVDSSCASNREMELDVEPGSYSCLDHRPRSRSHCSQSNHAWYRQSDAGNATSRDWCNMCIDTIAQRGDAAHCFQSIAHILLISGLQVNTDYSGMGGVEMAITQFVRAIEPQVGRRPDVEFWRSSEIGPTCRRILSGPGN